RFLFRDHLPRAGAAAGDVHAGLRGGTHGRLGGALERDDDGFRDTHRAAAPALCRAQRAGGHRSRKAPRARAARGIITPVAVREPHSPKRTDVAAAPVSKGTTYPPPYVEPCRARERLRLGDAAGLTQFGVNLLRLPPGAWSAQRHWHVGEDEFVF